MTSPVVKDAGVQARITVCERSARELEISGHRDRARELRELAARLSRLPGAVVDQPPDVVRHLRAVE